MIIEIALRIVGVGLVLAGAAHAVLPRVLGWSATTGRADGAMTALVIRMHVVFVGLFLALVGVVTVVTAPELVAGGPGAAAVGLGSAVLFGARWVAEITWVGRALRATTTLSRWWWRVHLLAMIIIWPGITAVYLIAGLRALG